MQRNKKRRKTNGEVENINALEIFSGTKEETCKIMFDKNTRDENYILTYSTTSELITVYLIRYGIKLFLLPEGLH